MPRTAAILIADLSPKTLRPLKERGAIAHRLYRSGETWWWCLICSETELADLAEHRVLSPDVAEAAKVSGRPPGVKNATAAKK